MLKKRILASSLASVMALSSVSVVAFADETATANYGEAVTKAELKEYVASFDKFIESEIEEFGTTQSEQFLDAYDHAKSVVEDGNATEEDATAAYQMLKSVRENMKQYTKKDLEDLLGDCKADYDTNNERDVNVENDLIWTEGSWDAFAIAYADAEICLDYDNGRDITNLYVELKKAHDDLDKLKTVSKTEFRAAQKEYEAIIASITKYEGWRRGTFGVNATSGGAKDFVNDKALDLTDSTETVTYADLLGVVTGASGTAYQKKDYGAGKVLVTLKAGTTWVNKGGETDVETYVKKASEAFEDIEKSNVTSNPYIRGAYEAALDAVKVFKGWKADSINFARKENINTLIKDYQKKFVAKYVVGKTFLEGKVAEDLLDGDSFKIKDKAAITALGGTYGVNENGEVTVGGAPLKLKAKNGKFQVASKKYDDTGLGTDDEFVVKAGMDLTSYVPVDSTLTTVAAITDNLKIYEDYLKKEAADKAHTSGVDDSVHYPSITALDTNNTIKTQNSSSAEYTLIYRVLRYAFEDNLPTEKAADNYKIAQLEVLIEKCYILAEEVGDFAKFNTQYNTLVEARKGAIEFVREAKAYAKREGKAYKDGETKIGFAAEYQVGALPTITTDDAKKASTTDVYKALEKVRKALADEYAKYPVSFGEIAEKIAEVSDGVENGVYGEKIAEAVANVAFKLSTLETSEEDNTAFNEDRALNKFNRLLVNEDASNKAEKALYADYTALLKAMEETASEVVKGDADGDRKVTINDALRALKASIKAVTLSESEMKAADVDGAPGVTALDALTILKMALKIV